ncbi:phospholipase A1 4-like [Contarinia nasturtii]|uniref:phospholipase A1 4-like n=1 Tax=Contarinia nasturtii TaxID=265458 RepID=UPI0012D4574C|nr:phospholipase A1 4-like [Contarinia nasturtii]
MIIYFIALSFVSLLSGCNAVGFGCGKPSPPSLDELDEFNPPIVFACIFHHKQPEISLYQSDNNDSMSDLLKALDNGKDLSLYFMGFGDKLSVTNGLSYQFCSGWCDVSATNICRIYHSRKIESTSSIVKLRSLIKKALFNRRLEFVSRKVGDFVLDIRNQCKIDKKKKKNKKCIEHMSQINVHGFSLGSHAGAFFCRYMNEKIQEKCPLLIGYDPAELHPWLDQSKYIQKGDAEFVQLIHTSGVLGTRLRIGDVDVSVKYKSSLHFADNHFMGFRIQELSTSKRFAFIANRNGPGSVIKLKNPKEFESIKSKLKKDQCLLGVVNNNVGKFRITITDKDLKA